MYFSHTNIFKFPLKLAIIAILGMHNNNITYWKMIELRKEGYGHVDMWEHLNKRKGDHSYNDK